LVPRREIVAGLVRPYFDVFDLFAPAAELIASEIKNVRNNAAGRGKP
jgi:hypothetical protein